MAGMSNSFIAKSATVAGVVINGTVSCAISRGVAQVVDIRSAGELYAKKTPVIPGNVEVTVETRDIAADVVIGTAGALSLVADKHGDGVTLSGTVTYAASTCVITGVEDSVDINGAATKRITARINSADGTASGLTVTSA
jgi:hypothetical protein